jgi:hypothetical protein
MLTPLLAAIIVFGIHPFFAERSYSPFLPIALVLYGAGTQYVIETAIRQKSILRNNRTTMLVLLLAITLALPAIYSWQIVSQGFSGREQLEKDNALARMKGSLVGKKIVISGATCGNEDYQKVSDGRAKNEPMLIVLVDYYDPNTPA